MRKSKIFWLIKEKKNTRQILRDFSKDANFFGLNLLVKSKHRYFWILALILLISGSFFVNISSIIDYIQYDVISS